MWHRQRRSTTVRRHPRPRPGLPPRAAARHRRRARRLGGLRHVARWTSASSDRRPVLFAAAATLCRVAPARATNSMGLASGAPTTLSARSPALSSRSHRRPPSRSEATYNAYHNVDKETVKIDDKMQKVFKVDKLGDFKDQ